MKPFFEYILELSVQAANDFATKAHSGQVRKSSGDPYVVHPTAVYKFLRDVVKIKDRNTLVAAYLHDTIEDSDTTQNMIKREFNKDVAKIVQELSSSPKGIAAMGKEAYLAKKMIQMSNNALVIKLADRWHNLQDINTMPAKWSEKYIAQTQYIFDKLKRKRALNKTHKKIIRIIEKRMESYKPR